MSMKDKYPNQSMKNRGADQSRVIRCVACGKEFIVLRSQKPSDGSVYCSECRLDMARQDSLGECS